MYPEMIKAIKERWVGSHCWLMIDGREYDAKVTGRELRHAVIAPLDSSIPAAEFAWHVVGRVMTSHKRFI